MIGPINAPSAMGMRTAVATLERSAMRSANPVRSLDHIEREVVAQQASLHTYQANAAFLRTSDEILGTLFDAAG